MCYNRIIEVIDIENLNRKRGLSHKQISLIESEMRKREKSATVALLLWLFLGFIGGHRFYLGDTMYAVVMLLCNWMTFGIWGLVDGIFIFDRIRDINYKTELQVIKDVERDTSGY